MTRETHWQRLLHVLEDGQPHNHHELYALGMIVHSRVADLRHRGYVVEQWREDGPDGPAYIYRLAPQESTLF